MTVCQGCHQEFDKPKEGAHPSWNVCPMCETVNPKNYKHKVIDTPPEGSSRWYKERWFRKDQKTWEKDIASRKYTPDGNTIRVNKKGERIG